MPQLSPLSWVLFALCVYLIGLSKGGLGGLLGALSTPILVMVMTVNQALGLVMPVLILSDLLAMAAYWRRWDWKLVWPLLPGALIGVTAGTFFITLVPAQVLQVVLGIIVLIFTAYKLLEKRLFGQIHYQPRRWHAPTAGVLAGLTSALANMGWPPVTIYLLLQEDMNPVLFNACSVLFFAILNWIKVPYYWSIGLLMPASLLPAVLLSPLIPLGIWSGLWLAQRIPAQTFERVILVLMAFSALLLIFT
jgi:uncharacterized protein